MNGQPQTAVEVLNYFPATKNEIASFAQGVIEEVKEGKLDILEIRVKAKAFEKLMEAVNEGTKENQAREAEKWGDKPFEFQGATLHMTTVKTEYDYSNCKDPVLLDLQRAFDDAKIALDERKEYLKRIPYSGETIVLKDSGEVVEIHAPSKKQTPGLKISLK